MIAGRPLWGRISLVPSKIKTVVDFAHQVEELSIKSVSDLEKNLLDYLRDFGICVNKIELMYHEEEIHLEKNERQS